MTRRHFLRTLGVITGGAGGVGLYAWRVEPHWLEFVSRRLPIASLPPALVGCSVLQLSDIHAGPRVDDEYIATTFRRVAALRPDIVVMTGDFISYHDEIWPQMERVYRSFPRGQIATFGILGNHDYGINWAHPEVADRVASIAARFGIIVLRNQRYDLNGLQIVGLEDLWGGQFGGAGRILSEIDRAAASLVLSHNPDTVDLPVWGGYNGWILSGHTHGGQCKPPFLPPPLLPVLNRRYTAGEFRLSGQRRLYINRGVGHLLHVRFNVRPEVTVHELCAA